MAEYPNFHPGYDPTAPVPLYPSGVIPEPPPPPPEPPPYVPPADAPPYEPSEALKASPAPEVTPYEPPPPPKQVDTEPLPPPLTSKGGQAGAGRGSRRAKAKKPVDRPSEPIESPD